jgi:hypothetical protein
MMIETGEEANPPRPIYEIFGSGRAVAVLQQVVRQVWEKLAPASHGALCKIFIER